MKVSLIESLESVGPLGFRAEALRAPYLRWTLLAKGQAGVCSAAVYTVVTTPVWCSSLCLRLLFPGKAGRRACPRWEITWIQSCALFLHLRSRNFWLRGCKTWNCYSNPCCELHLLMVTLLQVLCPFSDPQTLSLAQSCHHSCDNRAVCLRWNPRYSRAGFPGSAGCC